MKTGGYLRVAALLTGFTVLSVLYLMANDQLVNLRVFTSRLTDGNAEFLVQGAHCTIANVDPFHPSIQQYLYPTSKVTCSTHPPLTEIQGRSLIIRQNLLYKYKTYSNHRIDCCFSDVTRIHQTVDHYDSDADRKFKVHSCKKFDKGTKLKNTTEFVLVRCKSVAAKSKRGKVVYENMHATVPEKKNQFFENLVEEKSDRLNIIIIGIDSVSRLSLRRTMPDTLRYLNDMDWLELDGYNKVGDNTFPNLMALLAGETVRQVTSQCLVQPAPRMDNCPSLWRDAKALGYVTAYAEDVPSLATFNYKMPGFVEQPTDHYMRPFMLAAHSLLTTKNKDGLPICIGPQSAADLIFDYAKDFANTYKTAANYFGLFWLNSFSHNDVNAPAALDHRLLQLLSDLEPSYNNTVILLLSDHGIRFGSIRNSFQGFLEERLPFIFFHFPPWYLNKYPEVRENLVINRNRLTSPFDVHATLRELMGVRTGEPLPGCPTCQSLLRPVSKDRSCDEAGISHHWCTCPDFIAESTSNQMVQQVGQYLFHTVLNRTQHLIKEEKASPSLCSNRTFNSIIRVHRSRPIADKMENETSVFVIVILTHPFALFEATVSVDQSIKGPIFKVLGFISRLDSYFATTKCVSTKMLQFYCHCAQ